MPGLTPALKNAREVVAMVEIAVLRKESNRLKRHDVVKHTQHDNMKGSRADVVKLKSQYTVQFWPEEPVQNRLKYCTGNITVFLRTCTQQEWPQNVRLICKLYPPTDYV